MTESQYREARKRVKKKKDFYEHLTTFIVMSVFFFLLNMVTAPGSWWFYWPILGWGFGVVFHYLDTYGVPGVGTLSKEWEERAIEEEVRRLEGRNPQGRSGHDEYEELELRDLPPQKRKNWSEDDLV